MSSEIRRSVACVVPCYNAGERLAPVVAKLTGVLDHVIIVDDGSTDGAPQALPESNARLVVLPENQGKGHAMVAGFRAALETPEVDCVVIVDADGQHDPAEIPGLCDVFRDQRADLVIGSRSFDLEQVPFRSRLGNKLTAFLTHLLLRQSIPDTQSGFRLHSRALLERLLETVTGGRYETEMEILVRAVRGGFKVVPAPIATIYEEGNPSSHFNKLADSYRIYKRLLTVSLRVRNEPRKAAD